MNSNPYGKLQEALRVYVNPSLELINKNEDLSKHCYYVINKLPNAKSEFWTILENMEFKELVDYLESDSSDLMMKKKGKSKKKDIILDEHAKMLHNIKLAQAKIDKSYLEFLNESRPKSKLSINLIRRKAIIDTNLAEIMEINEEDAGKLTSISLKMRMHEYIAKKELQDDNEVMVDKCLVKLLALDEELEGRSLHYFKLLKFYNRKYVQRFSDSDDSASTNSSTDV